MVAKVDRLARHVIVFYSLLTLGLPIYLAEYPTLNMVTGTLAQRSAVMRSALEGHLEGLRISERTKAVMPLVRKRKKKLEDKLTAKCPQSV